MRKIILILVAVVITGLLGLVFSVSGTLGGSHVSFSLSSGWISPDHCNKDGTGCVVQDLCIAPIAKPNKGVPLRYSRANPDTCYLQTNRTAEILNWVIYAIVAILITVGFSQLIKSQQNDWKF